MDIYIETERMILRQFNMDDAKLMLDLDSDPDVVKYTGGITYSLERYEEAIKKMMIYQDEYDGEIGYYIVLDKESKEFMGWFHLRPEKKDPKNTDILELGYRFKKKFWNKGYATEGSKILIKKAFDELRVSMVTAIALPENIGSTRVMEKCGLVYESSFFYEEKYNVVRYIIDKNMYKSVHQ